MKSRNPLSAAALAAGLLVAGCATPPANVANVASAAPSCAQIAESRALAEEQRQQALEEQASSWKVLVPLVAAAKLAQSTADLHAADQRIAALDARYARMGCAGTRG